jgi:hypothetical protein
MFKGTALAGKFNCGRLSLTYYMIDVDAPRPPDVLLKTKTLQLQWDSHQHPFPYSEQLVQLIAQGLRKEYTIVDRSPDVVVKVSLVSYGPASQKRYTQTSYGVATEFWESDGIIALEVIALDKTGHPLDSAPVQTDVRKKQQISFNGNATGFSPPTDSQLEGNLLAAAANYVFRRYTATVDHSAVKLACDDELKAGNDYARAKQWDEASKYWQNAQMKKNPSDQTYNLAVAKEVLAYEEYSRTQDLEVMLPKIQEALGLYGQALKADPTERYIRDQVDRITAARDHIETARRIREVEKLEEQRAGEAAQKAIEDQRALEVKLRELQVAVSDTAPDSADEAEFRLLTRSRIGASSGEWSAQEKKEQIGYGQRNFQLSEMRGARVVFQEINRKRDLAQKMKDYQDAFAALVAKGHILPPERAQMVRLQARLGLDQQETKDIESKFKFAEAMPAPVVAPVKTPTPPVREKKVTPAPAKPVVASPAAPVPGSPPGTGIGAAKQPKDQI